MSRLLAACVFVVLGACARSHELEFEDSSLCEQVFAAGSGCLDELSEATCEAQHQRAMVTDCEVEFVAYWECAGAVEVCADCVSEARTLRRCSDFCAFQAATDVGCFAELYRNPEDLVEQCRTAVRGNSFADCDSAYAAYVQCAAMHAPDGEQSCSEACANELAVLDDLSDCVL